MNPVHTVLRNCDLLRVIINFLTSRRRDVVAVALVCRVLSDLALDILWRDTIHLDKIILLFPMDIICLHPRGEESTSNQSLTRIPATPQHWERFDVYASRIHKLVASPLLDDLFLLGVWTRYPIFRHPFPNLTCLEWRSTPSRVMDAMTFICPTLMEVQLSIKSGPGKGEHEDDDAVADILRCLGETCSGLRKFECTHFQTPTKRSKAVETSLVYLIRQCRRLEHVLLPVSCNLMRALGSLPYLRKLLLRHMTWEDGLQLSPPIKSDQWIEDADRFPVLDDLNIQGSHTVSSLMECFQGSGCFPRESFTMYGIYECEQWSTLAIAEFFRGILHPDRIEGLQAVWIDRYENPMGHDSWQSLRCLYSILDLKNLTLDGLFLDINDMDLEEISRIWPELRSLHLEAPEDHQSQISFQGLAHLSNSKHLESVSLSLAPESTISELMLSPSRHSNSPLKILLIQDKFPPVTPYAAAMFLVRHFPRLRRIMSMSFDEQEEERIKEIKVLFRRMLKKTLGPP